MSASTLDDLQGSVSSQWLLAANLKQKGQILPGSLSLKPVFSYSLTTSSAKLLL